MNYRWIIKQTVSLLNQPISLRNLLEGNWLLPRRIVHYLRIRKNVLVNGSYRTMNLPVNNGDKIEMRFVGDEFRTNESRYLIDNHQSVQVLFENRDLMVVNKPAGIKTHPNWQGETGTLMNFAAAYLSQSNQVPYMVHRIDQQTSGAVIIAKNPVVVPILDRLISSKQIKRQYLAITDGTLPQIAGVISAPIGRDPDDKRKRKVNGDTPQQALTEYKVISQSRQHALVRLNLQTGRTHQIRVHLKSLGAPIVGDPLYNDISAEHMLLHGATLHLVIPFESESKIINVKNPTYFNQNIVKWHLI
ncbi:RluA family pseudouridine synthase [Paucilactobacillus suebicus]|uniref:Pseudouridine synthase n=1 Tax=Paucilactobacillus suebicus DSM 5007 = KCTC 3549 TaxID=1423807 RepID=A0A0R1W589_9LACO|nr:RluA family pseudouridine synthase [Paucilactobacillus suebicus]KRM12992.1 pseudouridylate synthase [Paucilactobacillus suebicus DSM 5007 = KCTC 3549]